MSRIKCPFGRITADGLWEIPGSETLLRTSSGDLSVREIGVRGRFPEWVHDGLCGDSELAPEAAQKLVGAYFPAFRRHEICAATGIPEVGPVWDAPGCPLDPVFCRQVLREYEYRYAVCDFDVRLGGYLVGLQAVHVKWPVYGGPDNAANGLALCRVHQVAFNQSALGLEAAKPGYRFDTAVWSKFLGPS